MIKFKAINYRHLQFSSISFNLRERLDRCIINNNTSILKVDCALFEAPRFEYHNHREEFNIGSILIADLVHHVEEAHALSSMDKIRHIKATTITSI